MREADRENAASADAAGLTDYRMRYCLDVALDDIWQLAKTKPSNSVEFHKLKYAVCTLEAFLHATAVALQEGHLSAVEPCQAITYAFERFYSQDLAKYEAHDAAMRLTK